MVEASSLATDVLVELDGAMTLAEVIELVAENNGASPAVLEREVLGPVRELLELGALRLG